MKANENIVKRIVELTAPAVAETEATVERVVQDGFTTLYARARARGGDPKCNDDEATRH